MTETQLRIAAHSRQVAAAAPGERHAQYLAFGLGGETFAMGIGAIKEVIQYGAITEVPLMPDFIRGVINLRGSVVPVVDLAVRFGRPRGPVGKRTCVVILELEQDSEGFVLGALVDNVSEVMEIDQGDIQPAPAFGSALRSDFIAGVAKVGGHFVILLDAAHVLSVEDMAALSGQRCSALAG